MIIVSAAFGQRGMMDIFGFNLYIAETEEFEEVPLGSAVITKRCEPYELSENNLVLYTQVGSGDNGKAALGYLDSAVLSDGVYTLTVSDSSGQHTFEQDALIGKAERTSVVLGAVISFALTPFGVCVMAVLPCVALILYDIIRAVASKLPPPEVAPRIKNTDEDNTGAARIGSKISVTDDGKAAYSRQSRGRSPQEAKDVLFSYSGKQREQPKKDIPMRERPIIPLSQPIIPQPEKQQAASVQKAAPPKPAEVPAGNTPPSVAASKYLNSVVSGSTAHLPEIPKKAKSDAFFAQSEVPQIGKQRSTEKAGYSGRKSSVILSQKSRDELIADDDDSLDRSRYEVDDILAGLEHRKKP